jgi:hypothetical protein
MVWGENQIPIYLWAWHVLKAWHLCSMEKIKNNEGRCVILDDLHIIMYMPMNQMKTLKLLWIMIKARVIQSFTQHLPSDSWIQYFCSIIFNLVCDLILNLLLLFHHVVHIPNYSCTFKLGYLNMNACIVHVGIDLWMMGFRQMLHSSQNT